jgi:hypothetical protein
MGNRTSWRSDRQPSYVEALGGHHLMRITAYDDPVDARFAHVDLQLLEHAGWHDGLRLRIRNALRMLRGRYDGTGLIEALRSATTVAFGERDVTPRGELRLSPSKRSLKTPRTACAPA